MLAVRSAPLGEYMQLILAIAALCQVSTGITFSALSRSAEHQLRCHQSYLHCVNVRKGSGVKEELALEKCILEKK